MAFVVDDAELAKGSDAGSCRLMMSLQSHSSSPTEMEVIAMAAKIRAWCLATHYRGWQVTVDGKAGFGEH
jgi:hypothetical protein